MKTCPYCAEEIENAAVQCPYCRADLNAPLPVSRPAMPMQRAGAPSSGSNAGIIIAVVAGVGILALMVIGILIALLLPAVQQAREAARRSNCKNNLKQIGIALHNYHDVYRTFPPAYVADEQGNPMHSWRVLILPFIDQQPLYQSYDFSKPWDDPANAQVLNSMPAIYRCPSDADGEMSTTTAYAAAFGPNCIFTGPEGTSIREITDGTSNTLLVGEATDAEIPWTKPEDVDITLYPNLGDPAGFFSRHSGGVHFVMADGSVRFVSFAIDPELLKNLFDRNDGQPVGAF